jgi:hypothetical protein
LLENRSKRRGTVRNFVTKGYKYVNTADIMTLNIASSRLFDNIRLVNGVWPKVSWQRQR